MKLFYKMTVIDTILKKNSITIYANYDQQEYVT